VAGLVGQERLRVGIVAPPWVPVPPEGYGGTEAMVDVLARGLQEAGHEVHLVCREGSTCPVDRICPPATAAPVVIGDMLAEIRHVATAYQALRDLDVDVVHDHTLLGPLIGAPEAGCPVVVTHHGPFDEATIPLFRTITRHAAVVAISRSQCETGDGIPISRVIHHGLELDGVAPGAGDGGYLLYLGRMVPEKGAHLAVRAARSAAMPLRIAAKLREPAEHEYFDRQVEPLLGPDAEYLGEVSHDEKMDLLRGATALLNPIRWDEPFGLVMLEALSVGTPVVTLPSGAAPEIVVDGVNGYVCREWAELVEALHRVGDIDRAACRASAERQFSSRRMVDDYLCLYRDLVAARGPDQALLSPAS
jgi:glycosyltransferase involved in cell wall biosynthesis